MGNMSPTGVGATAVAVIAGVALILSAVGVAYTNKRMTKKQGDGQIGDIYGAIIQLESQLQQQYSVSSLGQVTIDGAPTTAGASCSKYCNSTSSTLANYTDISTWRGASSLQTTPTPGGLCTCVEDSKSPFGTL